jgi:hypothetical protein
VTPESKTLSVPSPTLINATVKPQAVLAQPIWLAQQTMLSFQLPKVEILVLVK